MELIKLKPLMNVIVEKFQLDAWIFFQILK